MVDVSLDTCGMKQGQAFNLVYILICLSCFRHALLCTCLRVCYNAVKYCKVDWRTEEVDTSIIAVGRALPVFLTGLVMLLQGVYPILLSGQKTLTLF